MIASIRARSGALLLVLTAAFARASPEPPPSSSALAFLRERLAMRPGDIERLREGQVVARMVEDPGFREIAVMAAMALPSAPSAWTSDFALIERLRRASPDLVAIRRLGVPAALDELDGVEVDTRILEPLQKCRQERCVVNGSRKDIDRYMREIEWSSADPQESAGRVFRSVLHERMLAYQRGGDAALPVLASRPWELTTADVPRLLLERRPSLAQVAPALDTHFRACAAGGHTCPNDVFYWMREKMWKREVVGLYHATFDDERTAGGRRRVAAEKLVYANHYLLGALTITGLVEDASGAYVFFLNRSETDNRGAFNFIERALANRLIKRRLERQVRALRDTFSTPAPGPTTARSSAP